MTFHSLFMWKITYMFLFEWSGECRFWYWEWKGYRLGECTVLFELRSERVRFVMQVVSARWWSFWEHNHMTSLTQVRILITRWVGAKFFPTQREARTINQTRMTRKVITEWQSWHLPPHSRKNCQESERWVFSAKNSIAGKFARATFGIYEENHRQTSAPVYLSPSGK